EVYATVIGRYRGYGGPAREPVASAVNLLEAHVWQHKLDGGRDRLPVDAQQLVWSAISGRLMSLDSKSVGNRLELLFFFVNAMLSSPPPGPMDERSMSWIHQPDYSVIDVARKLGRKLGDSISRAENRQSRRGRWNAVGSRVWNVNPKIAVLLFTGEMR